MRISWETARLGECEQRLWERMKDSLNPVPVGADICRTNSSWREGGRERGSTEEDKLCFQYCLKCCSFDTWDMERMCWRAPSSLLSCVPAGGCVFMWWPGLNFDSTAFQLVSSLAHLLRLKLEFTYSESFKDATRVCLHTHAPSPGLRSQTNTPTSSMYVNAGTSDSSPPACARGTFPWLSFLLSPCHRPQEKPLAVIIAGFLHKNNCICFSPPPAVAFEGDFPFKYLSLQDEYRTLKCWRGQDRQRWELPWRAISH